MLATIKQFFDKHMIPAAKEGGGPAEHALQLATAALLLEMMRMDHEVAPQERQVVTQAMRTKFGLSEDETATLIRLAEEEAGQATDYHQFTTLINKHFSLEQKTKVVEYLWWVAYADHKLDKYEEHMVRKVADLLYVPHTAFMAAKHRAKKALQKHRV